MLRESGFKRYDDVNEPLELQGYCINIDGEHNSPIPINDMEDVANFITDNVHNYYELKIVDKEDYCAFQVIDEKLIFPIPDNGSPNNRWCDESRMFHTVVE